MGYSKLDRLDKKSLASNPRANLASWLRYSSVVYAAFRHHPNVYEYTPVNMAATTVASRIRDAIRGCLAFEYPSDVPHADLERWYAEVAVKTDGSKITIGPPQKDVVPLEGARPKTSGFPFTELTLEEIIAFTVLLSSNRITGPVTVTNPPDVSLIPERPNVTMMSQPDGSLLLL